MHKQLSLSIIQESNNYLLFCLHITGNWLTSFLSNAPSKGGVQWVWSHPCIFGSEVFYFPCQQRTTCAWKWGPPPPFFFHIPLSKKLHMGLTFSTQLNCILKGVWGKCGWMWTFQHHIWFWSWKSHIRCVRCNYLERCSGSACVRCNYLERCSKSAKLCSLRWCGCDVKRHKE